MARVRPEVSRLMTREVHAGLLGTKHFMQGFVADSYVDIQAARLMMIHCEEKIGSLSDPRRHLGDQGFRSRSLRARRRPRGPGLGRRRRARTLRLADGPDEVHKILIAKNVLKHYHAADGLGSDFGN